MEFPGIDSIKQKPSKARGGRPVKAVKRKITLTIKCTAEEATLIKSNARQGRITVSEYLRTLGVTGKIVMQIKSLNPEVLKLTAALNHDGALLNQIAKKRNSNEELTAFERGELSVLTGRLTMIVSAIEKQIK